MSEEVDNLQSQLLQFGMSEEQVTVYLELLQEGKSTPLRLSKKLKLARTKVYRILDKLMERGLVVELVEGHGKKFEATDPKKLLEIVNEKEKDLLLLKSSSATIVSHLANLASTSTTESKIKHYRGVEGLKQVVWNSTKVKDILRIYEYGQSMNNFLEFSFAEKIRKKFVENNNTKFLQLTNHKQIDDFTQITQHVSQWESRFIDKKELDIKVEVQIYKDVYCMYEYANDDIFIVEIYNQELADFQKQVFDLIWKGASKMKKVGEFGRAEMVN